MTDPAKAPRPWGTHDLRGEGRLKLSLGPLTLHLRASSEEIWLRKTRGEEPVEEPEGGGGWTRWATAGWDGRIALVPAMPDRTVVVEPEDAFWLTPGAEARIYVRVPLWARLEALGTEPIALDTLRTQAGSDTWWGTFQEGELCYWYSTSARRSYDASRFQPHLAMCPVRLVNRSADSLPVEKIALRVAYLSLFADEGRIWTDETHVRYQGDAEGSQLDVGGAPPPEAPAAEQLAHPRAKLTRGLRAMTFARLRSLQGWI